MQSAEYLKQSLKTDLEPTGYETLINEVTPDKMRLVHAVLGLSGETGEVTDIIKKYLMYDKPFDKQDLLKEISDICWYMAIMLDELDSNFEIIMQMNIDKLKKRYPNGFNKTDAISQKDMK